jgi:F0F1-type ATP synthase membrane subunit b/b'
MPQMDKVAFFSQLFWLMITFYGFYIITVNTHLPNLARILKVRKKKVEFALKQGSSFQEERASTVASYENVFVNSATESRNLLTQLSQSGSTWLENSSKDINNSALTQLNQDYVLLSGELRGKRFVVHQLAKAGK